MNVLKGIAVSEGIAFGKLKAYKKVFFVLYSVKHFTEDSEAEILKFKNSKKLELEQLYIERDKAIAQLSSRLANMRSNLMYLEEQIYNSNDILNELKEKDKSIKILASKKLVTPIDEAGAKIDILKHEIASKKDTIEIINDLIQLEMKGE